MSQETRSHTIVDRAVDQARHVHVSGAHSDRIFEAIVTARANPIPVSSHRLAWIIPSFVVGVLVATIALWTSFRSYPTQQVGQGDSPEEIAVSDVSQSVPVQIADRVAIVAGRDAQYVLEQTELGQTAIRVIKGRITTRLFPGAVKHRLVVRAGLLNTWATGTTFSVGWNTEQQPFVVVHEGTVGIEENGSKRTLSQEQRWPEHTELTSGMAKAADTLGAHILYRATRQRQNANETDSNVAARALPPTEADMWQSARLLRNQGKPRKALAALQKLQSRNHRTWSPLALIESIRINAEVVYDAKQVVELSRQFRKRYPNHVLLREVTGLECAARKTTKSRALPSHCETSVSLPKEN